MLLTGQRLDFRLRSVESMGADTYSNLRSSSSGRSHAQLFLQYVKRF